MLTLCIRTDKPESELYLLDGPETIASVVWEAHRQLGETIHKKIDDLLHEAGKAVEDVEKVIVYKGPGSFTGLRIGISVANSLSYGLHVPIVSETGDDWIAKGMKQAGEHVSAQPMYGADPHITKQKK